MANENGTGMLDMLRKKFELAQSGDFFGLLGVGKDTPEMEIRKEFLKLVKLVHPDNLVKNGLAGEKEKATVVFKVMSEAYETLTQPQKRAAYLRSLAGSDQEGKNTVSKEQRDEESKIALHQGRLLLKRKRYEEAVKFLERYITFHKDDPQGYMLLGWAIYQNTEMPEGERLEKAKINWKHAVDLNEKSPDANYYLSLYYKHTGNYDGQSRYLNQCLTLDPRHVDAQREKRLMDMRTAETAKKNESVGDYLKRKIAGLMKDKGKKTVK